MSDSVQLRLIAETAAIKAGQYLSKQFRTPMDISHKQNRHDVVTLHDMEAERIIGEVLSRLLPGSIMCGEESGVTALGIADSDSDSPPLSAVRWHVDPLDGTSNFAQGLAFFCSSVAAEFNGEIVAGAIYDPEAENLFSADDHGAWLNGAGLTTPPALPADVATVITGYPRAVDLEADGAAALTWWGDVVAGFSSVRRTGSGALSIAHVAAGWTDASFGTGVSPWDVAAAMLILRRAGGQYQAVGMSKTPDGATKCGDHYASGYLATAPGADYSSLKRLAYNVDRRYVRYTV